MSNGLAKALYDYSPAWAQSLLISGYGLTLSRARYGGQHRRQLDFLLDAQWRPRGWHEELQARELGALLEHAQRHVPFYRALFAEYGVSPATVDPASLGRLLPTLGKDDMRRQSDALLAENYAGRRLHTTTTSGTTGTPLNLKTAPEALQKNYAFFERFLAGAGVSGTDRSATFAGRVLLAPAQKGPPYWRYNWAMNTLLCSSYHISDATAEHYLRRLERLVPAFIDSYPSAIYPLAQALLRRGQAGRIRPKAIVTSSETLLEHQRSAIEQAFACPVFDHYGSAEMAGFITQCDAGSYHINPEFGIVEVVKADGTPAAPGESGELVCTGFLNWAMPVIRYRTGDSAVLADRGCSCGRAAPVVESLLGRLDDTIITTDGRQIGRLDPLFKGLSSIKEAQIVQVAQDRVVINIVPDPGYTVSIGDSLVQSLADRVGTDIKVELNYTDSIPRTASGKFRAVICELDAAKSGVSQRLRDRREAVAE